MFEKLRQILKSLKKLFESPNYSKRDIAKRMADNYKKYGTTASFKDSEFLGYIEL